MDATPYLATAVAGLLGKIVFDWLKRPASGNGDNGHSGDKSAAWWRAEIRSIVEDVMDRRNATLKDIMRQVILETLQKKRL